MRRLFRILACLILAASAVPGVSAAAGGDVTLGLGASVMTSEYKKTDATFPPLPLIRYEGERFYLRDLTGGLILYKTDMHEFSITLGYMEQHYRADGSRSRAMRQLNDRDSTFMGGVSYRLTTRYGVAAASFKGDILGKSDGLIGDLSYAYPFYLDRLILSPALGLMWTSAAFNDYYYGVSGKESRRSGLKKYDAGDGVSPYLGLHAILPLAESWSVFATARAMALCGDITDSPMVDDRMKYTIGGGIQYSF